MRPTSIYEPNMHSDVLGMGAGRQLAKQASYLKFLRPCPLVDNHSWSRSFTRNTSGAEASGADFASAHSL